MNKKLIYVTLLFLLGWVITPVGVVRAEDFVAIDAATATIFRQTDGQVVWTSTEGTNGTPTLLEVGPDGNVYVSTSNNKQLRAWNGATGDYLGVLFTIGNRLYDFCFGPDVDGDGIEDLYTFEGAGAVINSYTSSSGYTEQGPFTATTDTGAWVGDFGPDVTGDGVQELYIIPELLQNTGNQLRVIDGAKKTELYTVGIPEVVRPGCLVAGSDGRIYVTGRNNDVVVSYLPDITDAQVVANGDATNFAQQIAEGNPGEWYVANRFNVTGLPADAGSIVFSPDNWATTSILIAGTTAADNYSAIASFDSPNKVKGPAITPSPSNGATDVLRDSVLTWVPGDFAGSHHVYFGEAFDAVDTATVPDSAAQTTTSYDPGRMEFGKTYFWRVDEVNATPDKTVFKGDVWSFEVEPYSIPIPGSTIVVTASSSSNEFSIPENTVDGSGLDVDTDAHGMALETMWFTATGDLDPWIQFEFDGIEQLDTMKVWNSNSAAEMGIGWGVKDVEIVTSVDGDTWAVADANQFSRAPGLPSYNQFDTIALGGVAAKYVKLNIKSNWGGVIASYGLSEVQFMAIPAAVRTPEPVSDAVDVQPDATATWRAGHHAAQHIVYVSADANAVMDGSAESITTTVNRFDLSEFDLQMGQTYYWRVDEVNEADVVSVWTGPVWTLNMVPAVTVDDFEGYGNLSPTRPFQTWLDGFGYSADEFFPVAYAGNGTGAGIGHDIWSPGGAHFDGTLMEKGNNVPGSGQSMPFYYTNTNGVASQTERSFAQPQDWTIGGAKTLSINFFGQAGNTGTLYVKINNTKITYPHDAANIAKDSWQAWNIDLSAMNVQSVTKLQIGVEGAGASGMILIDDIRLYPTAGEIITPVDPGTNGLVAEYTFENNANDVSGNGNNGTLNGGVGFSPGVVGSALDCDGVDGYMSTDKVASDLGIGGNNPRTISSWVYTKDFADGGIYDVGARANAEDFSLRTLGSVENQWRVQYWGGDSDFIFDTAEKWVNFVHVHDGTHTKIYANGMLIVDWEKTINTTDTNTFQIGLYGWPGNYFYGLIDEVKVYNRALSAGEALWLAGITNPIDKPF